MAGAEVRSLQKALHPPDLPGAGQEDQRVAALLAQGAADGGGHGVFNTGAGAGGVEVAGLHREGPALAGHHRGVAQQCGDRTAVQRRGHHHQPQVVAQCAARLLHQGQRQIAVDAALVELVEQHGADRRQLGVLLKLAQEQAVGHHLDPGLRPDLGVQPHTVPDRLADAFPQHRGHAAGGGAGGQPPRLQHDHLAPGQPGPVEQGQRHAGGLARPRRRLEHRHAAPVQRGQQLGKHGIDGKGRDAHEFCEPVERGAARVPGSGGRPGQAFRRALVAIRSPPGRRPRPRCRG
nr:hypothetical protein [Azospirillum baldaniorum]